MTCVRAMLPDQLLHGSYLAVAKLLEPSVALARRSMFFCVSRYNSCLRAWESAEGARGVTCQFWGDCIQPESMGVRWGPWSHMSALRGTVANLRAWDSDGALGVTRQHWSTVANLRS